MTKKTAPTIATKTAAESGNVVFLSKSLSDKFGKVSLAGVLDYVMPMGISHPRPRDFRLGKDDVRTLMGASATPQTIIKGLCFSASAYAYGADDGELQAGVPAAVQVALAHICHLIGRGTPTENAIREAVSAGVARMLALPQKGKEGEKVAPAQITTVALDGNGAPAAVITAEDRAALLPVESCMDNGAADAAYVATKAADARDMQAKLAAERIGSSNETASEVEARRKAEDEATAKALAEQNTAAGRIDAARNVLAKLDESQLRAVLAEMGFNLTKRKAAKVANG